MGSATLLINDYCDVLLSVEQVAEIVGDKMDSEWMNIEYNDVSPFMDTAPREDIMDIVANHFLGRHWPTYAENTNMREWYTDLHAAIQRKYK
jgi:hypothetical protein